MLFGIPLGGCLVLMVIVVSDASANGCVHNGVPYQNGDTIQEICIDITCVGGQWETNEIYNGNCGACSLSDDPHIITFDYPMTNYDWHGTCNYSISQLKFGYNEDFGIYGQFQQCGSASCVHLTTFTDNPNAVVEIDHSSLGSVTINGNSHMVLSSIVGEPGPTQPVLFWKSQLSPWCSMFLGSQGLLLKTCPNQIFVWAHPKLEENLNGLCGHFNFDSSDEFTDRNNVVQPWDPNPFVFPQSWLTADQSAQGCKEDGKDPCQNEDLRMKMIEVCVELLGKVQWKERAPSVEALKQAIMNCGSDLCNLEDHRTRREEIEGWKEKMQAMLVNNIIIEARTRNCENDKECLEPYPMD